MPVAMHRVDFDNAVHDCGFAGPPEAVNGDRKGRFFNEFIDPPCLSIESRRQTSGAQATYLVLEFR